MNDPSMKKSACPVYRIYPLVNGRVAIAGNLAFVGGAEEESYRLLCYLWLILGGPEPMLVCAGLNDVEGLNREAKHVLREPLVQHPHETGRAQLRKFGLTPADIRHVFVTHLHFDHVDALDDFPHATVYIGRKEWEAATDEACVDRWGNRWGNQRIIQRFLTDSQWKERLVLVDDQELLPGIESLWVGGHTPGSTAYCVRTAHGTVVLAGDLVTLADNLELDIPPGINMNEEECLAGFRKIREKADIVLPSHDPIVLEMWPPVAAGCVKRTIHAIKVGECDVVDRVTFHGSDSDRTRTYFLYVWLLEGGEVPILVETGPNPRLLESFNRSTAAYIPGGIRQAPGEDTLLALARCGVDPGEVRCVIVTHLHADHYDYFDAFPNAQLVVNRTEFEANRDRLAPPVMQALRSRPSALRLVEEEEVAPGVRTIPLGFHTAGSQAVLVHTHLGHAVLTGDAVYLYENIETNRPANPRPTTDPADREAGLKAMATIRSLADIILPAHDPQTLERWPGGIIGGKQDG